MRYPFGAFKNSSNIFRRHVYPPFNGWPYVFDQDRWLVTEITIFADNETEIVVSNSLGSWTLHVDPQYPEGDYGSIQIPVAPGQTTIAIGDGYSGTNIEYLKINNSIIKDTRIL